MARKLMRTFGLALIALPEPFTTPLGVGLLLASYFLFNSQKADSYLRLQKMVREYLNSYQPSGFTSSVQARRQQRALLLHPPDSSTYRVGSRGYAWSSQPRMPAKTVHHTINRGLWRQYRDIGGRRGGFHGYWSGHSTVRSPLVHHHLNRGQVTGARKATASV